MSRLVNHAPTGNNKERGPAPNTQPRTNTHNKQKRLRRITKASVCAPAQVQNPIQCFFVGQRCLFILPPSPSDLHLSTWLRSRYQGSSSLHHPGLRFFTVLPNRLKLFVWYHNYRKHMREFKCEKTQHFFLKLWNHSVQIWCRLATGCAL